MAVGIAPAFALDPTLKISQYHRTSWAGKEGAPTEVTAIVQAADGYLWLGTPEGLTRFDGISFEHIGTLGGDDSLGSEIVRTLCADSSGGIWMGFGLGHGVALYKDGKLIRFKGRTATRCVEVDGVTWLVSNNHLARFENGRLEDVGASWGLPVTLNRSLFADQQKTIWTFDANFGALWYLPRGQTRFRSFKAPLFPIATVVAPDGTMWGTSALGLTEVAVEAGTPSRARFLSHRPMAQPLFDRDGGFWANDVHGLIHVGTPGQIRDDPDGQSTTEDSMTVQQGLSSDNVWAIHEDREGNIWVGTATGLERFRDAALVPIKLPGMALPFGMASAGDGSVWTANWNSGLLRVDKHARIQAIKPGPGAPGTGISGFFSDPDGSVWTANLGDRLWRITRDGAISLTFMPKAMAGNDVASIARDTSGALWIASGLSATVARFSDGTWTQPSGNGLPDRWFATRLTADHEGRVWAAQRDEVLLIENGTAKTLGKPSHGLDVGDVLAFFERERGARMWVGGSTGVAAFDGSRFHNLKVDGDITPTKISGIVEAANGDLWLHGRTDGFRVEVSELRKFYANPDIKVIARHFDASDGLYGAAALETARSTLVEGSDGIIWFSSTAGLAFFDTTRKLREPPFPKVHIQSISAGDTRFPVNAQSLILPPLSKSIALSYTATSLGMPERIRFKHRLDGVDDVWHESGTRRVATYNDLSPGSYRFRLMSTNEQGAWGDSEATVDFRVPPAWFQTWTFRLLAGLVVGTLLWLAYRTRVGQLTARVRWQLKTQQTERDRIARDLHDTLLQGVQGLIWRFHTLVAHLSKDDPVRVGMESALDTADAILAQSRDRVQDLRGAAGPQENLQDQLQDIGENLAFDRPASFSVTVLGLARETDAAVQNEICYIVREALSNAFTHSGASKIEVIVAFGERELGISVSDNGTGIEPGMMQSGKARHFGLTGMRERADGLGASFRLVSSATAGTQVQLSLKASIAYKATPE